MFICKKRRNQLGDPQNGHDVDLSWELVQFFLVSPDKSRSASPCQLKANAQMVIGLPATGVATITPKQHRMEIGCSDRCRKSSETR